MNTYDSKEDLDKQLFQLMFDKLVWEKPAGNLETPSQIAAEARRRIAGETEDSEYLKKRIQILERDYSFMKDLALAYEKALDKKSLRDDAVEQVSKEDLHKMAKLWCQKPLSDGEILEIVQQFRQDKNPPYKDHENTYLDGWLDACNEIYWAIEERHGIK